jgi:hypothetical protein
MTYEDLTSRILPDCYLYISHLDEDVQYWRLPGYPDQVTDNMDSSFGSTSALGRTAPVYTYSSSGPRTIQMTLKFHRDMFEEINENPGGKVKKFESGEDMVEHFIKAIQAIAVPRYNLSNKAIEPPLIAIRLGREVFIKGIVSGGVSVTYEKPILSDEKYAVVQIGFTVSEVDPYDSTTVYKNGSFRGHMHTMREGMNF